MTVLAMTPLFGFVSTGDKTAMFTLRIMYRVETTHPSGVGRMVMNEDCYIKNLSTDKDRANEAAAEICQFYKIPLKGSADFDLNEIKRNKSEAIQAEREAQERFVAEQQRLIEEAQTKFFNESMEQGVFLVGKYIGKTAKETYEIDPQYIQWVAERYVENDNSKFQVNAKLAKTFIEENNITFGGFVGEVGETVTVDLTLKSGYVTQGRFTTIIWTALTEDGKVIKFFSTAAGFKALKDGDKFKVTGTVKEHSNYMGKESTLLHRPKLVK